MFALKGTFFISLIEYYVHLWFLVFNIFFFFFFLSSGKGSIFGTFEQEYPLYDKEKESHLKSKPSKPSTPNKKTAKVNKNIYTNPAKKGVGYGYVDVTIGKYYEYMSDPYDRAKEIKKVFFI